MNAITVSLRIPLVTNRILPESPLPGGIVAQGGVEPPHAIIELTPLGRAPM